MADYESVTTVPDGYVPGGELDPNQVTTITVPVGPPGPAGPAGDDPDVYQLAAVTSWTQTHNRPYLPSVRLVQGGVVVLAGIEYPDASTVHLSFPTPFTGTVLLD